MFSFGSYFPKPLGGLFKIEIFLKSKIVVFVQLNPFCLWANQ